MTDWNHPPPHRLATVASAILFACMATFGADGPEPVKEAPRRANTVVDESAPGSAQFQQTVRPLLTKYCTRCHSAEVMKSGVRVDGLSADPEDRQLPLLKAILQQLQDGTMPPSPEEQPTEEEAQAVCDWITGALNAARSRVAPKNGSIRRLTVAQYRNALRELLDLRENLTDVLPPDGISKEGFTNNQHTLSLSPLQIEAYFSIAEKALDLTLVDEHVPPVVQNFRMDFGRGINREPCPDNLILGANNELLANADFVVRELSPEKPFVYQPFRMRTAYDFIEGYVGNDTIRGWRHFDSIYHSVFACLRGTPGYPQGLAVETIPTGLLLRPAIPSPEIFGQSNTYGPMANFKISLRELPTQGNFQVRVRAARYPDGLLLEAGVPRWAGAGSDSPVAICPPDGSPARVTLPREGIYLVEPACPPGKHQGALRIQIGDRHFSGRLHESEAPGEDPAALRHTPFLLVRLPAGELSVQWTYGDNSRLKVVALHRLDEDSPLAARFIQFEQRTPRVGVHVGLRRDCGSTLTPVGPPQSVADFEFREYVFEGAINNFPAPEVEPDNVNYLAGVREIGIRSEYTDGREMPRMLVQSVEFEGPYLESWPTAAQRRILVESAHGEDSPDYAREVLQQFADRAFRRPPSAEEVDSLVAVWSSSRRAGRSPRQSLKDALLVVLTAPQFLFLIETSEGPQAEDLTDHELASKLSFFLWNSPPDQQLRDLADRGELHGKLDAEFDRLVRDARFGRFVEEFGAQWLSLDKFDVVATDPARFPRLTRDVKTQLRREPIETLRHLLQQNLPARNLVAAEFVVANEVTADYYQLSSKTERGFEFVAIRHETPHLGGLLSQAAILAGLSDGRESNPIKRGAWVARKIVAEPPDDPPPNVPQLPADAEGTLTLRQKLERHRNQRGCVKCHSGIDPWGLPFESFDAGGLWKNLPGIDGGTKLPDGTEVGDFPGLRNYLAQDRCDQVAFSFLKHALSYAIGRGLSYGELVSLRERSVRWQDRVYRLQELLRFVIHDDLFLKK